MCEPSSMSQILVEKSIFQLMKLLSQQLSNLHGFSRKKNISHFQLYEYLLRDRHRSHRTESTGISFQIASCIQQLGLEDNEISQLDNNLQNLCSTSDGQAILQFLLPLANRLPQKHFTKFKRQPVGIFQCPANILDGSLFEQQLFSIGIGDNSEFHFDSLPGTNLPLAQKFFHLHGIPVDKASKPCVPKEQDLGYSSPAVSEVDWDEIAKLGPLLPRCSWEHMGQLQPELEKPFLSEAGVLCREGRPPQKKYEVSIEQLQQCMAFLLVGVSSDCFPFSEELQCFEMVEGLAVNGLTSVVLESIVAPALKSGIAHRRLELFAKMACSKDEELMKALGLAVQKFLILHGEATRRMLTHKNCAATELLNCMNKLSVPLSSVDSICCDSPLQSGVFILEQLCYQAELLPPGRSACVLYSLLNSVATAYFRILGDWIFEGEVDAEGAEEFFVKLQPNMLELRNRKFWTEGCVALVSQVPSFLHGLEETLMLCGKSTRLLKLCNKKEPLVCELRDERPSLKCCLQTSELAVVQREWDMYACRAQQVCGPVVTTSSQLERSKEQQHNFFAMIAELQQKRLQQIRATQKEDQKARKLACQKELIELQKQMEEDKARKAERLRQEQEEEERWRLELEARQLQEDRLFADERKELIRQHEELDKFAEKKLKRAKHRIKMLEQELETPDDMNSNPVCASTEKDVPDGNANLSQPPIKQAVRSVPTQLSLQFSDHFQSGENDNNKHHLSLTNPESKINKDVCSEVNVASSEAARNKVRVLTQEMNLITNYDNSNLNIPHSRSQDETFHSQKLKPGGLSAKEEAARNKARVLQHEWNTVSENKSTNDNNTTECMKKDAETPNCESLMSPLVSSSSEGVLLSESEKVQVPKTFMAYSEMTASIDSAPSLKTEVETPTETHTSAMSISYSSVCNLQSPSSALTDSTFAQIPPDPPKAMPTSASTASFLSAMSLLSEEPLKWSTSQKNNNVNTAVKKVDVTNSHFHHLLRQTVTISLSTQIKLVNQSILKLFLQDELLLTHIYSLKQYFFLVDGEFARHIVESLGRGLKLHSKDPRSLLNFVSLDSILQHALTSSVHGAKDPNSKRLSLSKRYEPTEFQLGDTSSLNCVQLQYQVSWPLCLIITPESLNQYDRVFSFLITLRWGVWAMDESFEWLQQPTSEINTRLLGYSSQYHQLRLFRHEMANFVQAFHSYIMNVAVLRSWNTCKKTLKEALTLDMLYKAQANLIKKVIACCLLKQDAIEVQKVLQTVFKYVFRFHGQLTEQNWQLRNGNYEHPNFMDLTATYTRFKSRVRPLLRNLTKIANRGYQRELEELLQVLSMNDFYELKL